ncbi:MAG TPA: hypothetical protein VN609_08335 [Propionibacteriaceae bacterium]|nr:hypothetical protein [Propionibacteriaceae bacterium]
MRRPGSKCGLRISGIDFYTGLAAGDGLLVVPNGNNVTSLYALDLALTGV